MVDQLDNGLEDIDLCIMRTRLETLLSDLLRLQADSIGSTAVVVLDQTSVGRLSRMDAMQNQAMSAATLQRRKQSVVDIQAALNRLDEGVFGDCTCCDCAIHPRRLDMNPFAAMCIDCATHAEKNG